MLVSRRLSLAVSLVVFAATCLCICADSATGTSDPSTKAYSCCDVDHGQPSSKQHPINHNDCRVCGLKVWTARRLTTAISLNLHDLSLPVAIPSLATPLVFDFTTLAIQTSDPPPPPDTLLSLHCQLTC